MKPQLVELNIAPPRAADHVDFRDDVPRIVTSQAFDWPGLRVESGINNIAAVNEVSGVHHYVSMNLDDRPVTLEVKGGDGAFRRVVLRRGAAWVCPADDLVSVRLDSDFRYVRVSIDPAYFDRFTADADAGPIELHRTFGIVKSQISHILGALVAESDAGNPGGLAFVEALAMALSRQIAVHAGARKAEPEKLRGGLSSAARRRALEMIELNLDAKLTIDALAAEVGLSPAHFARAFRESVGLPPHRYMLRQRLEHARRLLDVGELSLSSVAQNSGFADQPHFTRLFKREFGVTPGSVLRSRGRGL